MAINLGVVFIAFGLVDGLAIILTVFRLGFRLRIQRFWWEDMWAAVTLVFGTAFVTGQLVAFEIEAANYRAAIIAGWITTLAFPSAIWAARLSLLYSTIRIIPPTSVLRKLTRAMAVVLFFLWAIIVVLKTYRCVNKTPPTLSIGTVHPACTLSEAVVLVELPSNCVADAILVYLSLKLLWRVKLPRRLRRMILCLFSSSAIMTMSSISYTICYLTSTGSQVGRRIAFELEVTLALIVCNLLVAITYMYRVIMSPPDGSPPSETASTSEDDFTTPIRPTGQLTTVDLDVTLSSSGEGPGSQSSNVALSSLHQGSGLTMGSSIIV